MAQPAVGAGLSGPAKSAGQQDHSPLPTALLATSGVVATVPTATGHPNSMSERPPLYRAGGDPTTCTEVAVRGSSDQRTLIIETTEALCTLQDMLFSPDIPTNHRVQMVQAIQVAHPLLAGRAQKILDRLSKQGNGPRYEIFYSVRPLSDFVHEYKTGTAAD